MARLVKSGISPVTSFVIQTILEDDSVIEKEYKIGDMMEELRYIQNQEILTVTGKLSKINYNNLQIARNYGIPATLRSHFADDVIPVSIVVDCSAQYESKLIEIPCMEIIEDKDQKNVKRMKCHMKYGARFTSTLTDGEENDFTIWEGQDIQGLVYMDRGGDVKSNVRVVTFVYDANLVPSNMICIENGVTKNLPIVAIKDIGDVIPATEATEGAVAEAVKAAKSGMIALTAGEFTEGINLSELPEDVKELTVRGAWAGINANARKADPDLFGEETVVSGTITIPQGVNLILDGVTLTGNANIVANQSEDIEVLNSIVENLTDNGKDDTFVIQTKYASSGTGNHDNGVHTKLVVKNCYFGTNGSGDSKSKFKNAFELTGCIADGSIISGCHFEKGVARNNLICFYNVEDGATITVRDCLFEESITAIRVGQMGDVEAHYEFINNTYDETCTGAQAGYAGLLLIQGYTTKTISMAKAVIRMVGTVNNTDQAQLYYVWNNTNDTQIAGPTLPTLIIDGEIVLAPTAA